MNEHGPTPDPAAAASRFNQLLALVLILGAIVILGAVFFIQREFALERAARNWSVAEFGLAAPSQNRLDEEFTDANHDLLADPPADEESWLTPTTLVFSHIAGSREDQQPELWQPLFDALERRLGIPIEHRILNDVDAQLLELRSQGLHLTMLNTGAVPSAVNTCGFIPLYSLTSNDSPKGISTKFLVPAQSTIKTIQDLKNKRITFTSRNSNSGFKAPAVILYADFAMRPGFQYHYGFSTSHEESIRLIKEHKIVAAPVASDMLQRALAAGQIEEGDFRVIYESEYFPPSVMGCLYNLHPDLIAGAREVLQSFPLEGSPLGDALGADRFVPADYKNDWALIRRIDDAMGFKHSRDADQWFEPAGLDEDVPPEEDDSLHQDQPPSEDEE